MLSFPSIARSSRIVLRGLVTACLFTSALALHAAGGGEEKHEGGPAWWDAKWTTRKKITINTSAAGGNIAEPVGSPTVLLRLHDGVFNFMGAAEDGSDLRILAEDQKTVLSHHVEKWDSLLNEAYVWVKIPDVKPAGETNVWLYCGTLEHVAKQEDPKASFDTDTKLVYHFGETAVNADASATGAAAEGAGAAVSSSLAGTGQRLNGQTPITIPANPALEWSAGASMTLSAWIKPAALQSKAVLFSRRDAGGSFIVTVDQGIPTVEIGSQRSTPGAPLAPGVWAHLAITANAGTITVYVNGASYATLAAPLPALRGPSVIGKDSQGASTGFAGELDEFQLASTARSAAFIKFAAVSQGSTPDAGKLVSIGADEAGHVEHEGVIMEHVNLIKDISKDLTIDGWAVIIACGILAIVGGIIAVAKVLYLNKITKASNAFLEKWEEIATDLTALDSSDSDAIKTMGGSAQGKKTQKLMHQSPLYRLYHLGCMEVQKRIQEFKKVSLNPNASKFQKGLSGRSIQAIKATLHGGLMREVQKLNSQLVYLTIGIAGGPYLGLLGTVIGVMITFAVIAKSGQVEVNSIAPGIAGALLATVAGLAVAIPCLFAYSYISTRIKDAITDMETFIDEFVAKMAEHYKED